MTSLAEEKFGDCMCILFGIRIMLVSLNFTKRGATAAICLPVHVPLGPYRAGHSRSGFLNSPAFLLILTQ